MRPFLGRQVYLSCAKELGRIIISLMRNALFIFQSLAPMQSCSTTAIHLHESACLYESPRKINFPFCSFYPLSENASPNTLCLPSTLGFLTLFLKLPTLPSGCLPVVAILQASLTQTACPFSFLFILLWVAARIYSLCALRISFKLLIKLFLNFKNRMCTYKHKTLCM